MRIIAWNLGHQTQERAIKPVFDRTVDALRPDVLVLNEYVDGASRTPLKAALVRRGLRHVQCSTRVGHHNQVLIASRYEFAVCGLPPLSDSMALSNLLHVRLVAEGVELVGLRTPAYERATDCIRFWNELSQFIRSTQARHILYIGDLNADPNNGRKTGGKALASLRQDGWQIPEPVGEWSYRSSRAGSRIDHAVVSPSLRVESAIYWAEIDGFRCAGAEKHLYDHAPLSVDIDVRLPNNP